MQPLSASGLLEVWERGADRSPVEQALILLAAAYPRTSAEALAHLTIGRRDACLLQLRLLTFGPQLNGLAACPSCGERLELALDARDLQGDRQALPEPGSAEAGSTEAAFTLAPYEVTYRLPTSADLRLVTRLDDPGLARQQLLEACVLKVRRGKKSIPAGELPDDILSALSERMGQAESLADLALAATCPACGHQWKVLFDIVSFFWSEISAWAARLMREVHILASAYGWREAEILALSPWRRQRYLELIGV
jgi:hypothetical protein